MMFINGGVAQMKDNRLTILTNEAVPPEEIDAQTARAEYAEAEAQQTTDERSHQDRQRRMQRARAMQAMAKT